MTNEMSAFIETLDSNNVRVYQVTAYMTAANAERVLDAHSSKLAYVRMVAPLITPKKPKQSDKVPLSQSFIPQGSAKSLRGGVQREDASIDNAVQWLGEKLDSIVSEAWPRYACRLLVSIPLLAKAYCARTPLESESYLRLGILEGVYVTIHYNPLPCSSGMI